VTLHFFAKIKRQSQKMDFKGEKKTSERLASKPLLSAKITNSVCGGLYNVRVELLGHFWSESCIIPAQMMRN
jgi:hypothetical protein